jgi:gluconolactonase
VVTEEQIPDPNGILFSPEYKELYVISTGKGLGDTGPGGKGEISVFDVGSDNKLSNQKLFTDCVVDGVKCGPDGMRADVDGSLWVSSNAGRAVGYNGATCGILLASSSGASESLRSSATFMAGSQSLYALYTSTQGAAPG